MEGYAVSYHLGNLES